MPLQSLPEFKTLTDRLPPQNIEAEQSVLGALMLDKDGIIKVADILIIEDFYKGSHQKIYSAMLDLYERREPIDLLSLTSRLREKNQLEEIGSSSYLTELVNSVPTSAHIQHYARMIQRKRILRDLIGAASQISSLGYQEVDDVESLVDEAERKIFAIAQHSLPAAFTPIKMVLEEAFDRIDRLHKGDGQLRGLATGFASLDSKLAGMQKSNLIILAARPSLGKTSFALDIARHVTTKEKIPVGIFSLEMSNEEIVDRFIASHANVDLWKLRTGKLSMQGENNDFTRIRDALHDLSEAPIFTYDMSSINILQMRTMARRLQAEHGLGLIIIDYLQLIPARNPMESRVQQVTEISRSLKALARELNIPILALSQLSRAIEQRGSSSPKLSDLRESGSIEQDADVVLFIHRPNKDSTNIQERNLAQIIIAKQRNGPVGAVQLYFNEQFASFSNLDTKWETPENPF